MPCPKVLCFRSTPLRGGLLPLPHREGWGGSYTHDCTPKVVAIAVSTVIMILRNLPQVVLLLNVPIVVKFEMELNLFIKALFLLQRYCTNFAPCKIEQDRAS